MATKKQIIKGELSQAKCKSCEGGVPLSLKEQQPFFEAINAAWERKLLHQVETLVRSVELKNFQQTLKLANAIGKIAEAEGHHPNLYLHDYKKLTIELTTHAVGGLSVNDFILAAKIDTLL